MNEITYIGEHVWIGKLGNAFVVLSLVASILSLIGFYLSCKDRNHLQFARNTFYVHAFSVFGIAITLFAMLFNHYYEYQYVWQHSNNEMPMEYILSCFWEGQEGSFLLWTFWNVVVGIVLQRSLKNEWEAPVMAVFSLAQIFLATMITGIYIGDYKMGSNPFLLLREHPDFFNLPFVQTFVQNPDYVSQLQPRGLNPLLMNYWMTIHPPTLFLGFSATLPPFAFAVAALWNKKYHDWQQIALPWTYFGILILGIGILMGGAWAYEALSFGGFWAWDPVENSSLVPWLVLVGAGHVMIVNKNKGGSLFTTHLLSIASFLLVLYSTFLTRSGILGTSSVHAFTDLGMQGQLVIYVLTFLLLCIVLLIDNPLIRTSYVFLSVLLAVIAVIFSFKKIAFFCWTATSISLSIFAYYKYFPKEKDEEELFSREFWIFLGSLVLLLSSLVITYFTSIPVLNKLIGSDKAPLKPEEYNSWMVPFTMIMMLLMAGSQFLKYKQNTGTEFFKKIKYTLVIALMFGFSCAIPLYLMKDFSESDGLTKYNLISYSLLFITATFAALGNADYFIRILKGTILKSGAAIAHIGFALVIIGALVSTSKKQILSKNSSGRTVASLGKGFDDRKSILLTQGDTLAMGPYMVSYEGKERKGIDVYFKVNYFVPGKNRQPEFAFQLQPKIQDNPRMGKAAEPATRHYFNKDIYTHVTAADLDTETKVRKQDSYTSPKNYVGHTHDTIFSNSALIIIDSLTTNISQTEYEKSDSLLIVTAVLKARNAKGEIYTARPRYIIRNNRIEPENAEIKELGLKFSFWKINPDQGSIEITMAEKAGNSKDFIVMEAYLFPYINILWLGCMVMSIGTIIAVIERYKQLKKQSANIGA